MYGACSGGWGPGFCQSTRNITTVTCINFAVSGGTTGGFFESGLFKTSLAAIGAEAIQGHRTIVTVQYGCVLNSIPCVCVQRG